MTVTIDWGEPVIRVDDVLRLQPNDLDTFYIGASDCDKANLFFVLLTSFHEYSRRGDCERAAHLSFLMAYYLFVALTPPGSSQLAMHYIRQAVSLCPLAQYREWLPLIEGGN